MRPPGAVLRAERRKSLRIPRSRRTTGNRDLKRILCSAGEGGPVSLVLSRALLACGHLPKQSLGRGRGERGGSQQRERSGVAGNVRRPVQADSAARAGKMNHS